MKFPLLNHYKPPMWFLWDSHVDEVPVSPFPCQPTLINRAPASIFNECWAAEDRRRPAWLFSSIKKKKNLLIKQSWRDTLKKQSTSPVGTSFYFVGWSLKFHSWDSCGGLRSPPGWVLQEDTPLLPAQPSLREPAVLALCGSGNLWWPWAFPPGPRHPRPVTKSGQTNV